MPPGSRSGSRQERGGRAGDCRRMETAAAALPQMRAFAGRLRVAARMRAAERSPYSCHPRKAFHPWRRCCNSPRDPRYLHCPHDPRSLHCYRDAPSQEPFHPWRRCCRCPAINSIAATIPFHRRHSPSIDKTDLPPFHRRHSPLRSRAHHHRAPRSPPPPHQEP